MKKVFLLASLLLFSASQAQITEPGHIAQAVQRTMTVDADLSDWQGLPQYKIELSNTEEPVVLEQSGYYSVAWDENFLYLAAVFQQAQDSLTIGLGEDAEEWWLGDTFEVFLHFGNPETALHYAVSPDGSRYQAFLTSTDYEASSFITEMQWHVELAFPLDKEDLPAVQREDSWSFKVGRGFHAAQEFSLWPRGGDFLGEDNYGLLYFTEKIESDAVLFEKLK